MTHRKKKTVWSLLMIFVFIFFTEPVWGLHVDTHRIINEDLAKRSFLGNYLKEQLGLQDGVYQSFDSKMIWELLGDGGEDEDNILLLRMVNHFHNPIYNSGFSGIWNTVFLSGMSAIDWAMQPVDTQPYQHYSWNDARDYYYKALTSEDKATREANFTDTFRAIGQVMHLVQDISVPEHTRNNGHYFSHNYEDWVKGQNVSDYSVSVVSFTPSASIVTDYVKLYQKW